MPYLKGKKRTSRLRRSVSISSASQESNCVTDDCVEYQSDDSEDGFQSPNCSDEFLSCVWKKGGGRFLEWCKDSRSCSRERKRHSVGNYQRSSRVFGKIIIVLFTVTIVLIAFYFSIIWRSEAADTVLYMESIRKKLQDFEAHLSQKMGKFENFTGDDLYTVSFVGRQWFMMLQKSPVVMIFAGNQSRDVVDTISEIFHIAFQLPRTVDKLELTPQSKRADLHKEISRAVHSDVPLVVLNGIDQLYWDAPLVLHAFSDSSFVNTPHTLLLLSVKKSFHAKKVCEQSLMEYLSTTWISSGGSPDNVLPVLSRIMQFIICL